MSEHTVDVTDATFEDEVINSELPVLVDFWATWCNPCLQMAPIVDEVAQEMAGKLKVCKIDLDQNPATQTRFGITSIPTFMVFKGGKEVRTFVGGRPKTLLVKEIEAGLA